MNPGNNKFGASSLPGKEKVSKGLSDFSSMIRETQNEDLNESFEGLADLIRDTDPDQQEDIETSPDADTEDE